ncbi:MAG: hypothetical protein WC404_07760, partial [Candidatus Omnitrophota bacterium]
ETVSREELNRVLQEILKEIDQNHREYAKAAFWRLSEASVITVDHLEQVRALLLAIAEGAGEDAWVAYFALIALAKAVKGKKLNPVVLDLKLLLAIAKGTGESAWRAYNALGAIAEAVKKKDMNPAVLDLELFLAIAEGAGESTGKAYYALGAIAEAVKVKEMNPAVLDLELLLAIARGAGIFAKEAYEALGPLAKNLQKKDFAGLLNPDLLSAAITGYLALKGLEVNEFIGLLTEFVTEEEGLSRTNFQKRLEQYVYRMAFYKQVYARLPGSYEELNKNTYVKVIQEQGFDVLEAYVVRLAAAVRGKTEEDGREALRETISAIREEAEHSPTVEALFNSDDYAGSIVADDGKRLAGKDLPGDKNDGGTGKAVSREELKVVLREILFEINPNHHEYAKAAFGRLSEAGVITADHLEQVRALLLAIAEGAGEDAWVAYFTLIALAKAVKEKEMDPVVLDLDLLLTIAKGAGESAWGAYNALDPLAKNLQEKDFAGLLNPDLLSEAITGYLALQDLEVNKFISLLTEFVTEEEGLIRANFQKRLEQYVYRIAFYKQVYGGLPESYEELNNNTYIKVIQEQRFDVLMKYVARLAAEVRDKSEEAGREALREAISAIWEEAEHSPTVEALFGGEDYDGKQCDGGNAAVSEKDFSEIVRELSVLMKMLLFDEDMLIYPVMLSE